MTGAHIYNNWHTFTVWLDNSNWGAAIISLLIPAVPLGVYGEYQHRRTRRLTEAHHNTLHDRLDALFSRDDPEEEP